MDDLLREPANAKACNGCRLQILEGCRANCFRYKFATPRQYIFIGGLCTPSGLKFLGSYSSSPIHASALLEAPKPRCLGPRSDSKAWLPNVACKLNVAVSGRARSHRVEDLGQAKLVALPGPRLKTVLILLPISGYLF